MLTEMLLSVSHMAPFHTIISMLQEEVRGQQFAALPEGIDADLIRSMRCLSAREVQTAVRMLFPGELAKHAVSEGTKAVTKFTNPRNAGLHGARPRRHHAGLQFDVEGVVALASVANRGVLLTESAGVYLAAVLEYMSAEVLELAGNSARDQGTKRIRCATFQQQFATGHKRLERHTHTHAYLYTPASLSQSAT